MWNDPESIKKWWGPTGYSCAVAQNDLKIGGRYFLGMQAPDGKISYNIGIYTEIDPMKKIVSKLSFADESGTPVPASHYGLPGNWADEATVMVEFTAMDGKTQVQITESEIPMIMKLFAGMGWGQQFEKMDALLKQKDPRNFKIFSLRRSPDDRAFGGYFQKIWISSQLQKPVEWERSPSW